jgi:hypothetical protein
MNKYKISWLQSAHYKAALQSVIVEVDSGPQTVILADAAMNVSSVEYSFPDNASVVVFVRTFNEGKTEQVDSDDLSFVAVDISPLTPATNVTAVFVAHE